MKRVFSTAEEVLHVWASGRQSEARCSNVFFNDTEKVYSYGHHFCLARRLSSDTVAINRRQYSNTTSKHQSLVRRTTSHMTQVFVFDPEDAEKCATRLSAFVAAKLELAAKARSNRGAHLAAAADAIRDHNLFCDLLKQRKHRVKPLEVEGWSPEAWKAEQAKAEAAEKRREAAAKRKALKEQQESIAAWRAGQWAPLSWNLPTMLRLSSDGQEIETSRNARVPVADAVRAWPLIRRAQRQKVEYRPDPSVETHLGLYRLNVVKADGSIVVGCHEIAFDEIRGIAKQLELEGA